MRFPTGGKVRDPLLAADLVRFQNRQSVRLDERRNICIGFGAPSRRYICSGLFDCIETMVHIQFKHLRRKRISNARQRGTFLSILRHRMCGKILRKRGFYDGRLWVSFGELVSTGEG